MPTVDEILGCLAEVGLLLWLLGDTGDEGWYCVLAEIGHPNVRFTGNGATAVDALARALEDAGVKVD